MMLRSRSLLVLLALLAGCGGGGGGGGGEEDGSIRLLSVEGGGSVDGRSFTPAYGVSFVRESGTVSVVLGTGRLDCEMARASDVPEDGTYVEIQVLNANVGLAEPHFVDFVEVSGGSPEINGSGDGTVEVLAASESSIALDVDYDHVSSITELRYVLQGTFEVTRCP